MVGARGWGMLALFALCLSGGCVDARAASPEVSKSRGKRDGVVVLWPRIVPETEDPVITDLARRMQQKLVEVASASVDPKRVDVRPKPERVCPIAGCKATSLSLLLGHDGGGCALLGVVGPPEAEQQRLVQIAGRFQMEDAYLPFRAPPEGEVIVAEFVPCAEIEKHIDPDSFGLLLPKAPATAPAPAQPATAPTAP